MGNDTQMSVGESRQVNPRFGMRMGEKMRDRILAMRYFSRTRFTGKGAPCHAKTRFN